MKTFFIIILILLPILIEAQSDTAYFKPLIQWNNHNIAPGLEWRKEFREGEVTFGPRVGYIWTTFDDWDYFYFQQTLEWRGFIFSPVWLRRYNKNIGYQVPTSVAYQQDNFEIWLNWVYHARQVDAHLVYYIPIKKKK